MVAATVTRRNALARVARAVQTTVAVAAEARGKVPPEPDPATTAAELRDRNWRGVEVAISPTGAGHPVQGTAARAAAAVTTAAAAAVPTRTPVRLAAAGPRPPLDTASARFTPRKGSAKETAPSSSVGTSRVRE